ncbi:Peptidase S8/S53 subtilisin/kexin/sedolisin [Penicillium samsonianum]|uniref:Peptidase S8/S53 subtilisin/kexin/sedolisin n=1 Tax=Penicillium samsonianum TaxID=1882272 RepID=UPI002548D353|nr:Peptidase S8/S53 subtilisin/kexin/sedolisin [Penicillium samsonianum]KAJ6118182.1 Peptidase S8/S53 subtilisin/kexin/sedolisin [Penicillium samsonianum]
MSIISINGNHLDPEAELPVLRALHLESEDATNSDYILVQSVEPLSTEQEDEIEWLGVDIQQYVSKNTYLCGFKGTDLESIRRLPYISWVNVYLDMFVIQSSLKAPAETTTLSSFPAVPKDRTSHTVDLILHKDVDLSAAHVASEIAAAAHADPDTLHTGSSKIRINVQNQYLEGLATLDCVKSIQPVYPARLFNNRAIEILGSPLQINGTQYEGEGQVVAVADTGFDKGSTVDTHPAFRNRVKQLYALGRPGRSDDPDGHGTHVCGSVLGDGFSSTMGGRISGAAPKASLVVQSLLDRNNNLGGIPTDFTEIFSPPYEKDGARIHTNSWGSSAYRQVPYNPASEEIDQFVWDHQDMVILFAAGNDGIDADKNGIIDPRQIGAEAAAKNCITVGASENNRPDIPITYGNRWPSGPISKDLMADNPGGLAAFSSRGPTMESRIKPDVVAPGTAILSARSRKLVNAEASFGTSRDPEWWFLAGTSMATPLVAGCIAVLRETLIKSGARKPSAALLKALLINGAVELPGQYIPSESGPSPNSNSGFGRVDLSKSVILPSQADGGYREGGPLAQSSSEETVIDIPNNGDLLRVQERSASTTTINGPVLKVSLVWTDPPGRTLQNDLDLLVVSSDGTEKHGNMGDKPGFDRTNNVEQVEWTNIPSGKVKIIVRAYHIFNRAYPQPYALVWSINRPSK